MGSAEGERRRGLKDETILKALLRRTCKRYEPATPAEDIRDDIDAKCEGKTISIKVQAPHFENFGFELYHEYPDGSRRPGWWETGKAEQYLYGAKGEVYWLKKSDVQAFVAAHGWTQTKPTTREVQEREGKVTYNGFIRIDDPRLPKRRFLSAENFKKLREQSRPTLRRHESRRDVTVQAHLRRK